MPEPLPALNLIAQPGQRRATLDIAREIEQRGFAGISVSSQFSNMAQCLGLAFATERIPFATAIAPIYAQTAEEFAQQAAYIHEVSGGRFQFGIGVAHDCPFSRGVLYLILPDWPFSNTPVSHLACVSSVAV